MHQGYHRLHRVLRGPLHSQAEEACSAETQGESCSLAHTNRAHGTLSRQGPASETQARLANQLAPELRDQAQNVQFNPIVALAAHHDS